MIFYFGITEEVEGTWVRLRLNGELDLGSAPALQHRLEQLRAQKLPVRLDLSKLEFIDSSGIHLLVKAFNDARTDSWALEVEPSLSHQVARTLRLANVERIITGQHENRQPDLTLG